MGYKPIFLIDGVDFSFILTEGSIQWSRNDIDSNKTGRSTLNGKMLRKRIAYKRKLRVSSGKRLDTATMIALNKALLPATIKVTFLDALLGEVTKEFYGSTVEATTQIYMNGETYWTGTTFALIEV